jgi:hypothetical protein
MASPSSPGRFHQAHFGLLTLHGKESILAPALSERWQARLSHSQAFDTDSLGTFSGEVERRLSPVECALHKARLACELVGADFGLGSEGSFETAPWGFGVMNQELVACVPAEGDWHVVGYHVAPVAVGECRYGEREQQEHFWQHLPEGQGVMLIGEGRVAKGLRSQTEAMAQLTDWYGDRIPSDLRIAYDLRAHQSPVRREAIALAVANLLERLDSFCEHCHRPGFWPDQYETGLPCRDCDYPTNSLRARIARCEGCGLQQRFEVETPTADPATCPRCNP